ncbi:MAG: hypothetical protein ACI97B_003800 [Verrucomicrobiales bacterium]|jgi:hypothetical protein
MARRYRGETEVVGQSVSIAVADHATLIAGDMALTSNGAHCLVYIGEARWIQADPHEARVIIVTASDPKNHWLKTPVHFIRGTRFGE